ncbi:alpha/beta hydrolase [Spirochaeta africana]|uniref:Putative hydrolase of alpha/beta superfamily n=1 Tax=Spirochaeta africana (strain ATCC 700263 / DSM 8902 / Z-7692) TaxID=889378 RepID=H9UFD4_SPIAZ|nr:alpha/beta hydrolase-fold protein [Spirochaeta africana]AFG36227.1 putative hydrolase of alpha/beta superfamily [Spirochaeta africana DSM 8902]
MMRVAYQRYRSVACRGILSRHVDVWVPPQYAAQPAQRFPVLYMHDGQNLFDPELAYTGVTWGIAEAMERIDRSSTIRPAIVVGIWNSPNRFGDYQPLKPFATPLGSIKRALSHLHPQARHTRYVADAYLDCLVHSVKPMIDRDYRTLPDPGHTMVMGSSMGGLISLYALCEYPEIFGGAGCLSTHWPVVQPEMFRYLRNNLPNPGKHRLYFDRGTAGLDRRYRRGQQQMDRLAEDFGYREGRDYLSLVFEGHDHSERSWSSRIDRPLEFLLSAQS